MINEITEEGIEDRIKQLDLFLTRHNFELPGFRSNPNAFHTICYVLENQALRMEDNQGHLIIHLIYHDSEDTRYDLDILWGEELKPILPLDKAIQQLQRLNAYDSAMKAKGWDTCFGIWPSGNGININASRRLAVTDYNLIDDALAVFSGFAKSYCEEKG